MGNKTNVKIKKIQRIFQDFEWGLNWEYPFALLNLNFQSLVNIKLKVISTSKKVMKAIFR